MTIRWMYANKIGELPTGQAEIVEALVEIAEQLDRLNKAIKHKALSQAEGKGGI